MFLGFVNFGLYAFRFHSQFFKGLGTAALLNCLCYLVVILLQLSVSGHFIGIFQGLSTETFLSYRKETKEILYYRHIVIQTFSN